jgi:pimeloyl-ACP methyl ester carboxylesterase
MAWVEILGNDIHYIEAGKGQPLLFLHGMSSCAEAWWQQFDHFAGRYRVIAYDSVNHGHSSNSPRDQEETDRADELEAFLQALSIERPILAGNSMGGGTIMRWASRHSDRARALIVSGSGVGEPGAAAAPRASNPLDLETIFLPFGDSLTDRLKRERPRMYERYYRIRSTATRIEYLRHPRPRSAKAGRESAQLHETLPLVTSPMLVVVGTLDRALESACRLHRLVPNSQYAELAEAPHNGYFESAVEWNAAVDRFLSAI